jgi:outer membrane protein assembly factor BamA
MVLRRGDRFDETLYDQTKTAISEQLLAAAYACNEVAGWVHVDPDQRTAEVNYEVKPGPTATFGEITVEGNGDLPRGPILAASQLEEGDPYDQEAIEDAQRAIYALQSFTTVTIEPERGSDRCTENVPIRIRVTPARRFRGGVGAGLASGEVQQGLQRQVSIPQWDVHLRGVFEVRNFWGGLRRFRVENRPRVIFGAEFPRVRGNLPAATCTVDADCSPGVTCTMNVCGGPGAQGEATRPRLGNSLEIEYREPGFPEARTTLVVGSAYDLGPEPYNRYFRHDLDGRDGFERSFLRGRLSTYVGMHTNAVFVTDEFVGTAPSDYHLLFFESIVSLDLRDQPRDPRAGMFVSTGAHASPFRRASSWRYYRLTPEIRLYAPLPVGLVLAGRFGVGMTFIGDADDDIDAPDDVLGPDRYRLRGGGATSNRGFIAGDLGDPDDPLVPFDDTAGGLRLWEASVELRARITQNFGMVAFMDMGDVHQEPTFRWNYLHTTIGFGFRYRTIVGPIRVDFGFRLPELQVVGEPDFLPRNRVNLGFVKWDGAVHITLGEAF